MNSATALDKRCSISEAVALVDPGATVGVGGMMLYRRPVAACRALVEARTRDLTVVTFAAGYETELLVRAGAVAVLRTCYAGLEVFGPAPAVRHAVERGELALVDETELTLAAGLQAAAMGLPWLPSAAGVLDTDYPSVRPDLVEFRDPLGDHRLLAMPAIELDVCLVHAAYADPSGNAVFGAAPALDRELVTAAQRAIVVAEQVVTTEELLAVGGQADLLAFQVDRVVESPGGATPTACHPHYPYDATALLDYLEGASA